ncbi:Extracellular exo-alpha-(1-_5)-L-arabinofuranosidase [Lasiodiplodia hormozganensis]|uniref:Extracellular exo-alpha-(1->5)-L-arabinofuranosidase n=1 Tax=Lasiodiplodia hormozganensis TaxID=869390 RepID=A0AA39YXG9_9PEZI|nr:Extracellular exo-alpha-(1->5)-L-arabinofuranosidase [Lasiodiplodia hormozganensis]
MLLSGLFAASLAALTQISSAATFSNPLRETDGSDPQIVWHDGYYYLMTTTWTDVQLTRATTLEGLKTGERKTIWVDSDPSRCCSVWAPEIHQLDGTWYIYYSAGTSENLDGQRPQVLEGGAHPWDDDYTWVATLTDTWGIDGTVATIEGSRYFIWSCFENTDIQSLCIAPMTSPTTLGDTVLLSQPLEDWERVDTPVNEGPYLLQSPSSGTYYIAYSASFCWTTSYQLGLLTLSSTSADPLDPASWTKSGPVFSSANGNLGTAHNAFFYSPDGTEIWNVYHATNVPTGACNGSRYTMVDRVNWNEDGSPDFGVPSPVGEVMEGPAGEPDA